MSGALMKKIVAFVNLNSGSVPRGADEALARALSELGYSAEVIAFEEGDMKAVLQHAIDQSPDYLIAWGGDGSINCALSLAGANGPAVLALPGGTMNLLHKRLHHDRTEWEDILVSALTAPEVVPWAAGEVEGQRFYVAVMVGRLTCLSESRELFRKGAFLEAIGAAANNAVFDMESRLQLRSHIGARIVSTEATAGAIVLAGERRPRFEVAAIDPASQLDLVSVGFQSLLSGWRDAEDVSVETASAVTVEDIHGDVIPATIDGEPCELPAVSEFRLIPEAARVLRAKPVS
jgi:diacylglycerol kinase family enzyme